MHSRRRRIELPSRAMRESITLSSMDVHLGQRMGSVQGEKVLENLHATLGGDGFRMELDPVNGEFFVLQTHNFPLGGLGGDFEAVRQAGTLDQQGMITGGGKRRGQPGEDALVSVLDRRELAVHLAGGADDVSAEKLADRLMAEAHAQDGLVAREGLYHVETYAGIRRRAGTR